MSTENVIPPHSAARMSALSWGWIMLSKLRAAVVPSLPIYVMLIVYFFSVVLGQLLYLIKFASEWPMLSLQPQVWEATYDPGQVKFWLLLCLPFFLVPVAYLVRRIATPAAIVASPFVPEINKLVYISLCVALYAFVINSLAQSNAVELFISGDNAVESVENRFHLLSELGLKPLICLQSLLMFLTVYSTVRAARGSGLFWSASTSINVVVMTALLILLNQKWPAVIFILTLACSAFVISERRPYLKALVVAVSGMAIYMVLSVVVLRWLPAAELEPLPAVQLEATTTLAPVEQPVQPTKAAPDTLSKPINNTAITMDTGFAKNVASGTIEFAPRILVTAINRMSIAAPFYYDFPNQNENCGAAITRLWINRDVACEPSLLVYSAMFKGDQFAGRGTAPGGVNLYGYALDGWTGAIISTVAAFFVLGLFLSLWEPARGNAMLAAAFVMGCYTAYFYSQLPMEGPVIYGHGMLWWALMVLAWATVYWLYKLAIVVFQHCESAH